MTADQPLASRGRPGARTIVVGIALVALAALLWINREVLLLAFGAVVISTLFRGLTRQVRRIAPLPWRWAVVVTLVMLAIIVVAAGWFFGMRVADQFAQLQQQLPQAAQEAEQWVSQWPNGRQAIEGLRHAAFSKELVAIAAHAVSGAVAGVLLVLFGAIYITLDPELYQRGVVRLVPVAQRARVNTALEAAGEALSRWLRGQLLLMLAVGGLTGIGLVLIGVPLAFSLAVIIGVLEFIPLIGPIGGAIPGILLAFTQGPSTAFHALLVYVAVQQAENHLLVPLVQRWAVQLPPALTLFSVLACTVTFGLLGTIFATPLAVVAMVLVQRLYVKDGLEH